MKQAQIYVRISLPCLAEVNVYPHKVFCFVLHALFVEEKNVCKCRRRGRVGVLKSEIKFFILHKIKFAQKQYRSAIVFNMIYCFAHLN